MLERWAPVPGFEGLYEVSDHGRLRASRRQGTDGRVLRITPSKPCGYMRTRLFRGGRGFAKKVHRLVLEAFIGPCPHGMVACHKNGKRDDNTIQNLTWGSLSDNCADAKAHGTSARGERNGQAKLTSAQVDEIRSLRADGATYREISERFRVSQSTVQSAARGETWV